jgi:hypothetical protein
MLRNLDENRFTVAEGRSKCVKENESKKTSCSKAFRVLAEYLNIFNIDGIFSEKCGKNEAYSQCGSSCREPKCPQFGAKDRICPAVCFEGCFCADGFVRDPTGKCVKIEQCSPVKCPENQIYSECGAACEPTCV